MPRQLSSKNSKLYSEQNQKVASFLKRKREELGLKQKDFLKEMGSKIDIDIYRTWEKGRTIPKVDQVWEFLALLGSEGRKECNYDLGPALSMARGETGTDGADAHDGLAKIIEEAECGNTLAKEAKRKILAEIKKYTDLITR